MHLLHRLCNACAQVLTILNGSRCRPYRGIIEWISISHKTLKSCIHR